MSNVKIYNLGHRLAIKNRLLLFPLQRPPIRIPQQQNGNFSGYVTRRFFGTENITQKSRIGTGKMLLYSILGSATIGSGVAIYSALTKETPLPPGTTIQQEAFFIDKLPDVKITRKLISPTDKSNLDLVLFQYQTCPFCCKVRAFLDSKGLSYSVVEVDAVLRQSIRWSNYKKVPMLLAKCKDGRYIQLTDSSMIVSILASFLGDPSQDIADLYKCYPTETFAIEDGSTKTDVLNKYFLMYQETHMPKGVAKENMELERKWRSWADFHLVHLIAPNVYRTWSEALETFEWYSHTGEWDVHFPQWERNLMVYVGAAIMWQISKRLKKRYDLSDDVRWHIYNACDLWIEEITKKNTKFHGGKEPDLADISVFGILNSMEGCSAFKDCLKNSNIGSWFNDMKDYIGKQRGQIVSQLNDEQIKNIQSQFS